MANCEYADICAFFNNRAGDMPALSGIMKVNYCWNGCQRCARYMLYHTMPPNEVPDAVYPNQPEKVPEILTRRGTPRAGISARLKRDT